MGSIEKIKALLDTLPVNGVERIGIAITTHNRYEVFSNTLKEWKRFLPSGAVLVVVDDASEVPVPDADFRFENNVGIARAKNKCFELLYEKGCEHLFLVDDDTYPIVEDWYRDYVDSREVHLNYIFEDFASTATRRLNDTLLFYQDDEIKAYSHVRGCVCYYHRSVLEKVGGMDPVFGKWGYEHGDLSNRIYNAGLTRFKYMDVANNKGLFYSADENEAVMSTCLGPERIKEIEVNSKIYDSRKGLVKYVEFREKRNVILTSYFTTVADPQRNQKWEVDKEDVGVLINSCIGENLVVLNDCFEDDGMFRRVQVQLNPYFQRWVSYYEYLLANRGSIDKVFCVDATDVELLRSPWEYMEPGLLYAGDEPQILGCDWMTNKHPHVKLQEFFKVNAGEVLLNAGLIGGSVDIVIEFLGKFLSFYFQAVNDTHFNKREGCGDTDMGLFNYIARTEFRGRLRHGTMVNTEFKKDERNGWSWFKHK